MAEEMDYCQYYLNKCANAHVPALFLKDYKTTEDIRKAYESSSCFLSKPDLRDYYLIRELSSFVEQYSKSFYNLDLDPDAVIVLNRSIFKINSVKSHEDIFDALSDFLWVAASVRLSFDDRAKGTVMLTDNPILENRRATGWIDEIKNQIESAEYELEGMKEADKLPFIKHALPYLVKDPNVARFTNENLLPQDRKKRIEEFELFIINWERVYFSFLVTNFYHYVLQGRYQ